MNEYEGTPENSSEIE